MYQITFSPYWGIALQPHEPDKDFFIMKYPRIYNGDRLLFCDETYVCYYGLDGFKKQEIKLLHYSRLVYECRFIRECVNGSFPEHLNIKNTELIKYGWDGKINRFQYEK